jgi:peptidoglycan pentaglycine glycine transferase (the first glycine)
MPEVSTQVWDEFYKLNPQAHLFQSPYWGELKSSLTWEPVRIIKNECGAQILFRKMPLGYTMAYIPKGPIGNDWGCLWPEIDECCRTHRSFLLLIEPNIWEEDWFDLSDQGFTQSTLKIDPMRTIVIDISKDEEDILAGMKQKTRYNIGLARKKGVVVKPSSDIETFHKLMSVTCKRNRISLHSVDYFRKAYQIFHQAGKGELLVAEYMETPLAIVLVGYNGKCAWYLYGASSDQHRNLMAAHLLQWESIQWAKQQGCTEYDLYGIPDHDEEVLEEQFNKRNNGAWGVYRFKRGFGGQVKRSCQGWERVYGQIPSLIFKQIYYNKSIQKVFYRIQRMFGV